MAQQRTKPSTLRLSDVARHVVVPPGAVSTGWPAVEQKCADLGISFRPWQPGVGRVILAKRPDGKYAATIGGVGLSIPRQVGKTFLVGAIVFALCLLNPKLTVIWTAHRVRTAEETFGKMQAFARRKSIRAHIAKIVLGSGEESVLFKNGSRILFGAREGGFGLGFDEVDVLIFDEAQRLGETTLDDMIPATNQSRQETSALVLFMGTPPRPTDKGEVFTRMRSEALSGEDEDTAWIEFGADSDHEPTPSPEPMTERDWQQVAKANPSYPRDTPREAILRMRKKLGPDSFKREGLGIWSEESADVDRPFDLDSWRSRLDLIPMGSWPLAAVGLDMDPTTGRLWTAVCAFSDDGVHVELTPDDLLADGLDAAVERIYEQVGRRLPVVMPADSGATVLVPAMRAKRMLKNVYVLNVPEQAQACAGALQAVKDGTVSHLDDPVLELAVRESEREWLRTGGGQWRLKRTGELKAAPLWAAIAAHMGAIKWSKRRATAGTSRGGGVTVL